MFSCEFWDVFEDNFFIEYIQEFMSTKCYYPRLVQIAGPEHINLLTINVPVI